MRRLRRRCARRDAAIRGFATARLARLSVLFACMVLLPTLAHAQATLSGVVKDSSGGVLPGVTVEASSPVLIEKVRSSVTDGNGRYQIVDLRPGIYTVTFTLSNFGVIKREGVQLTGFVTTIADAELKVGAATETVNVSGESPIVDVTNTTQQRVIDQDTIAALPTARNSFALGSLIPGTIVSDAFGPQQDVGGALGPTTLNLKIHGSKTEDQRLTMNGISLSTMIGGGWGGGAIPNASGISEMTIDTGSVSADLATGGVRINFIPRDGGNNFSGTLFVSYADDSFQGDHAKAVPPDVAGPIRSVRTSTVKKNYDFNPGFGGPLVRDRLWFYLSARAQRADLFAPGTFYNANANNPNAWEYVPDISRGEAVNPREWAVYQGRITWQASPKNKVGLTVDQQSNCFCPNGVGPGLFGINAPEAATDQRFPLQRYVQVDWNSPVTGRILLEASAIHRVERWGGMHLQEGKGGVEPVAPGMISVTNSATGLTYRSAAQFNNSWNVNLHYRAAASYITGSHNIKVGFNNAWGHHENLTYANTPFSYGFNGLSPVSVTLRAVPFNQQVDVDADLGIFAQDRWTINRWTLAGGIRYDHFANSYPDQELGPGPFTPNRNIFYPKRDNIKWHDITPKMGATYDLFGNGRTALKASLNKYLTGYGTFAFGNNSASSANNPIGQLTTTATRNWNDADSDYVVDCDLLNPAPNNECTSGFNQQGFGEPNPTTIYDPALLEGWGKRQYNWELSAGVQHEVVPRVSVEVGYFRRWYGNFQVTDNRAFTAADFTQLSITAPLDPRLPGGGGNTITGVYTISPTKVGQQDNFVTLVKDLPGDLKQIEQWDGVDISANTRLGPGVILQGGMSTGRALTDNCEVAAAQPETITPSLFFFAATPLQFCRRNEGFITQVKGFAAYTIPRVEVQVAGTFQSIPGPLLAANYNASPFAVPSNGPFTEGPFRTIQILEPGAIYGDRLNQVDLRVGKVLRFGGTRSLVNLDMYNIFNADPTTAYNASFAVWQQPLTVLQARFFKISAQFDF